MGAELAALPAFRPAEPHVEGQLVDGPVACGRGPVGPTPSGYKLKYSWYALARLRYAVFEVVTPRMKALTDMLGLGAALDAAPLPGPAASPVFLLGLVHQVDSAAGLSSYQADAASRLWMTYRRDFEPLGATGLTSDVGWGCTLRSGQMLLAQALQVHFLGRSWRRGDACSTSGDAGAPSALVEILRWFVDAPSPLCPFSVHNLLQWGAPHGLVAGEWLGPSTICHTLAAAVQAHRPGNLTVHVLSSGGGCPLLDPQAVAEQCEAAAGRPAAAAGDAATTAPAASSSGRPWAPLLLLVPVVLGVGSRLTPVYLPQLRAVLDTPQSLGILGGRPGSSLYFVGHREEAVLFLDPHHVQPAAGANAGLAGTNAAATGAGDATAGGASPATPAPAAAPSMLASLLSAGAGAISASATSTSAVAAAFPVASYLAPELRHMPLAAVDPSMALAFYCRTRADFDDLVARARSLQRAAAGAPLLAVATDGPHAEPGEGLAKDAGGDPAGGEVDGAPAEPGGEAEWEML